MPDALSPIEQQKRAAGRAAVAEVRDGMLVGLGTGSTAAYAIEALAERVREGLNVGAVATSERTARDAARAGITLLPLEAVAAIDLCIDGVDEIDPLFRAIKGAGGAMLREKIVASAAKRMIAIADGSKTVARLGARPVPVEVLPLAEAFVLRRLDSLGCEPVLRAVLGTPVLSDNGNRIIDCHFARLDDQTATASRLAEIPGLLGHGLFLSEIDALYVGTADGVACTERRM